MSRDLREIKTLCPYCGVGCGLLAATDGTRVLRVRGDPHHPANFGKLCPKGATAAQTVHVSTRLRYPMVRDRGGEFTVVPPGAAIQQIARQLDRLLQSDGPGSIAFYLSGQLTTEAQYLATKFAKGYLRTNHADSNSRLCMSSAASGMALSLGSDGPPTCYADIDAADMFFFVGSNAAECHPVTFERVRKQVHKRGAKMIVVDPRRTLTAEAAGLHLAVKPATDLCLLNGLLRLLRDWGKISHEYIAAHTEGWNELSSLLEDYPSERVAAECGITESELVAAARILADAKRLITFWTMGVNQSVAGTFTVNAIINLHLATGQIGKVGSGPFSLTGQPNAMGGRDCGYMSHALPGYRQIANSEHRAQMESLWGLTPGTIVPEPGYDAVRMFDALAEGRVKAIWIIGTNPAASMPNLAHVRKGLERAELVIVQDAYFPTETTRYAQVILPAAVHFEQDGTFCNSERRVTLMQQVVDPPGQAKPDWWWVREVAGALGFTRGMNYAKASDIFDEFARVTAGRPNDQSGLYHDLLRQRGPQQWPYPSMGQPAERRYTDGVFPTPTGRATFWRRPHLPDAERPSSDFPLLLTTGRTLHHWHTRTKTGTVDQLSEQEPGPFLQMHPDDAAELVLEDGQPIEITSPRGTARSVLRLDASVSPGVVFLPIHWNQLWAEASSPNEATTDQVDPISKQPGLKCCAVRVSALTTSAEPVCQISPPLHLI